MRGHGRKPRVLARGSCQGVRSRTYVFEIEGGRRQAEMLLKGGWRTVGGRWEDGGRVCGVSRLGGLLHSFIAPFISVI